MKNHSNIVQYLMITTIMVFTIYSNDELQKLQNKSSNFEIKTNQKPAYFDELQSAFNQYRLLKLNDQLLREGNQYKLLRQKHPIHDNNIYTIAGLKLTKNLCNKMPHVKKFNSAHYEPKKESKRFFGALLLSHAVTSSLPSILCMLAGAYSYYSVRRLFCSSQDSKDKAIRKELKMIKKNILNLDKKTENIFKKITELNTAIDQERKERTTADQQVKLEEEKISEHIKETHNDLDNAHEILIKVQENVHGLQKNQSILEQELKNEIAPKMTGIETSIHALLQTTAINDISLASTLEEMELSTNNQREAQVKTSANNKKVKTMTPTSVAHFLYKKLNTKK